MELHSESVCQHAGKAPPPSSALRTKQVILIHDCNLSTQEVDGGGSEIQSHPYLYSRFNASLRPTHTHTHTLGKEIFSNYFQIIWFYILESLEDLLSRLSG